MSQPSMTRSGFTPNERAARAINQPGEDVTLREDFAGDIVCRTLRVEAGTLHGRVRADNVFLHGRLIGTVAAKDMRIGQNAGFAGECQVEKLMVAGVAKGLIRARDVVARAGACFAGELISDTFAAQENVDVQSRIALGKGNFENIEVLSRARERQEEVRKAAAEARAAAVTKAEPALRAAAEPVRQEPAAQAPAPAPAPIPPVSVTPADRIAPVRAAETETIEQVVERDDLAARRAARQSMPAAPAQAPAIPFLIANAR